MQITSAVVVAAAGLALLATSSPMGGQTPAAPDPVPRAVGTGSEDLEAGPDKGTSGTERVAITTRPIPLPPAAALAPASASDLDRGGVLVAAYNAAVAAAPPECHLPPALLAAIGQIESGSAGGRQIGPDHKVNPPIYGPVLDGGPFAAIRDTDGGLFDGDVVWDRAVGPMQFIPGTWRLAGVDGDADGLADPQNVYDAAFGAAGYLCRANRDMNNPDDLRAAIFAYNHSDAYVAGVLEWLDYFGARGLGTVSQVSFLVASGGRASQMQSPGAGAGSVNAIEATVPALTRPPTTTPTTTPFTTTTTTPFTTTTTTPGTTTTTTPGTTTTTTPADDHGPAADHDGPAADHDGPAADDDGPAADDHGPAADDHGPAADHDGPAADDHGPAADHDGPADDNNNDDDHHAADHDGPAADHHNDDDARRRRPRRPPPRRPPQQHDDAGAHLDHDADDHHHDHAHDDHRNDHDVRSVRTARDPRRTARTRRTPAAYGPG